MLLDKIPRDLNIFALVFHSGLFMLILLLAYWHHVVVWWFAFGLIIFISPIIYSCATTCWISCDVLPLEIILTELLFTTRMNWDGCITSIIQFTEILYRDNLLHVLLKKQKFPLLEIIVLIISILLEKFYNDRLFVM